MDLLRGLAYAASADPLTFVLLVLVTWVPACAAGLGVLAIMASLQQRLTRRAKRSRVIVVPPAATRPLAARRVMTVGVRPGRVALLRVVLALIAVLGSTAFALASSGAMLLDRLTQ